MEYKIQLIHFNNKKTHRILQNVGGPCPLLGLCNVLLLNNDIRVNQQISSIKFKDLTFCLKDHLQRIFERNMGNKDDVNASQMANAIQNIEDCVKLFPKLEEGLDINIKFSDVTHFEYTSAIAMFDNYNIRLMHGWCVDPQNTQLFDIIKDKSYNEVVDFLTSEIDSKETDENIAKIEQNKSIVRQFLSDYQQQLTAHGLTRMHEVMNDNEIAIFFRNNHFSAVYKRQGQIWELVTDEGIVDADPRITWQSLSQLSGDEQFVNNKFNLMSQNMSQQAQIESYNQTLIQKQINDSNINEAETDITQNKDENTQNSDKPNGYSIAEQDAYLQKQFEQSNKPLSEDTENIDKTEAENEVQNNGGKSEEINIKSDENIEKTIVSEQSNIDTQIAQRIALEQQLGLQSGELERLEKEQREAMVQLEHEKLQQKYGNQSQNQNVISSNPDKHKQNMNGNGNGNRNRNDIVYTQDYGHHQKQYQNNRNSKRKRKKKRKKSDDCIIL